MKAVILAGGGGTRLWPLSTPEKPKQFQKLVSEKTMLEETVERLDFLHAEDIYIAINEKHLALVKELCPGIPEKNIIVEPALRDTAPCIGFAAQIVAKRHPGEVMAIIYADHLIKNKQEFQSKLKLAEKLALTKNTLNIIEVEATEPNINYGYVKLGPIVETADNTPIYQLDSFKEKPDLPTAKKFLEAGNYLWNTGLYIWKAETILEYYQKYQPETHEKLQKMVDSNGKISNEAKNLYGTLEKNSLDYAIMEKIDPSNVLIIKGDLGWSDIGSFKAIWEELAKSKEENITRGETRLIGCSGCLIYADNNEPVAGISLTDTVIIDSPNGLLVCNKEDSKRVKDLNK
ncbi:mannose-1-phosphate guanylyltransferase [Candidatus Peregrinibacteria bacterium]|nr:mannose-1-phosphate guanylyltransferase [Candidatus Peregrinibacteria bacterium]